MPLTSGDNVARFRVTLPIQLNPRGRTVTTTQSRTAAATRARMRLSEEKFADRLRDRGWICIPPEIDLEIEYPTIQPWALRGILSLAFGAKSEA